MPQKDSSANAGSPTEAADAQEPPPGPATYERLLDLGTGLFYYRPEGTDETTWDTPLPPYVTRMAPIPLNTLLGITTVSQAHAARVAQGKRRRDQAMRATMIAQLVEARQAAAAQRREAEAAQERDQTKARAQKEAAQRQREAEEGTRRQEQRRLAAVVRARKRAERHDAALRQAVQTARQAMEAHCKDKTVRARLRRQVEKDALAAYTATHPTKSSTPWARSGGWWWWGNKPRALRNVEDAMLAKAIQDLLHKAEEEARAKFHVQCQRVRHVQRAWRRLTAAQCLEQWRMLVREQARHRDVRAYQVALQRQQEYEAGIVKLIWAQGKVDEWRQEWDDRQQFAFFLHRQTGEMRLAMPSVEEFMPAGYVTPQPLEEATLRLLAAGPPPPTRPLSSSSAWPLLGSSSRRSQGRAATWTTLLVGSAEKEGEEEEAGVWWDGERDKEEDDEDD